MEWLYDWIWNLVIYFILLTAVTGVLPKEEYKKYLRLFTGAVMVLVMLNPLMRLWKLDVSMEELFRYNSFEQERRELSHEMEGMQEVGTEYVMEHYRNALELKLRSMADEEGITIREAQFLLEEDIENADYGKILYLKIEAEGITEGFAKKLAAEFGMPKENINLGADYG